MIAPRTQNENSSYIFPDPCRSWVSFLLNYSSLSVMAPHTLIRILVHGAIPRSTCDICLGSLSERCKGGLEGDADRGDCQKLPNLAEKNRVFLLRLFGSHFSLGGIKGSRNLSLEKSRIASYSRIC